MRVFKSLTILATLLGLLAFFVLAWRLPLFKHLLSWPVLDGLLPFPNDAKATLIALSVLSMQSSVSFPFFASMGGAACPFTDWTGADSTLGSVMETKGTLPLPGGFT